MKSTIVERLVFLMLAIAYVVWASAFILQSSYIAIDGQRYFGLFDDAMISMRYAWHFAHGAGLVWNSGERVEGYSNLLMTLAMALFSLIFNKTIAVLAIQIVGIPTMLGMARLAQVLSSRLAQGLRNARLVGVLTFACVLFYFPISYWTLMGMETGLLALLILAAACFGLRWLDTGRRVDLNLMAIAAGLAFLARNDSVLMIAVLFGPIAVVAWRRRLETPALWHLAGAAAIIGLFIAAQTAFRYSYYGQLAPNTYTLKLTNYPLKIRLIDGTRFVLGFLGQTWLVFALAAASLWRGLRPVRVLTLSLVAVIVAYQVYVGGDAWVTWRMLAPGMPFLFALAVIGAAELSQALPRLARSSAAAPVATLLSLIALSIANLPFLADMSVRGPTSAAIANRVNTNAAIAINALTLPEASIGVIWAGTLPYYTDRYAIDFLGKSDPYIARLNADVSGSSGWGNQISIPGHNKYNLEYSIVQRKPVYAQGFSWGYDSVRPYFVKTYNRVEYHGPAGTKTIFLLKDSPLVCWEACRQQYRIVPWPK